MARPLLSCCVVGMTLIGSGGCGRGSEPAPGPDPLRALLDRPGLREARLRLAFAEAGRVAHRERTLTDPVDLGTLRAILGSARVVADPAKWEVAGDVELRFAAGPPAPIDLYDSGNFLSAGDRPHHVYYRIRAAGLHGLCMPRSGGRVSGPSGSD